MNPSPNGIILGLLLSKPLKGGELIDHRFAFSPINLLFESLRGLACQTSSDFLLGLRTYGSDFSAFRAQGVGLRASG